MTDLETSQSKLRSSPTGGVAGEHSGLFRRLVGAGYKGHLQGMLAGAGIDGAFGLVVGAVVWGGISLVTGGLASAAIIPVIGGLGALHGAHTFSGIGQNAAIIAESQQFNEHRRALLERYYETPSEAEAAEIKRQLEEEMQPKKPEKTFHWRTLLIGAAIGAVVLGGLAFMGTTFHVEAFTHIFEAIEAVAPALAHSTAAMTAVAASVGAAAGAFIGLDREYIRQWMDHSEVLVHDRSRISQEMAEHEANIARIAEAARSDTHPLVLAAPTPHHAHAAREALAAQAPQPPAPPHGTAVPPLPTFEKVAPILLRAETLDTPVTATTPPAAAPLPPKAAVTPTAPTASPSIASVTPIPLNALASVPSTPVPHISEIALHERLVAPTLAHAAGA